MRFLSASLSVSTAASVASGSKLAGFDSMAIARWAPESGLRVHEAGYKYICTYI